MTVQRQPQPQRFSMAKEWIVGLTGVLIVIPALVNSGIDIYKSLANVPRTQSEQHNVELFKQNFGKDPVFQGNVPIETDFGQVELMLEVHNQGDIFVRYGNHSQWLPFPGRTVTSNLSLFPAAYAQPRFAPTRSREDYQQWERIDGEWVVRERYYSDGTAEAYRIHSRTGEVESLDRTTYDSFPDESSPSMTVIEFPEIDLRHIDSSGDLDTLPELSPVD